MHWTIVSQVRQTGRRQLGDSDRHVGIYANRDNWRTCYPHMPIGMLGIFVYCLCVCVFLCLSAGYFVRDMSGTGSSRAMKFGCMVDLYGLQIISPFGELRSRGSPPRSKSEKLGNANVVDRLGDQAELLQEGRETPATGLRQVWHYQI